PTKPVQPAAPVTPKAQQTPTKAAPQPKVTTAQPPTDPEPPVAEPKAPETKAAAAGDCEIRSNAGNCYKAGQFCRNDDLGKSTHEAGGRVITCRMVSGKPHWQVSPTATRGGPHSTDWCAPRGVRPTVAGTGPSRDGPTGSRRPAAHLRRGLLPLRPEACPQPSDGRNSGSGGARRSARTTDRGVTSASPTRSGPTPRAGPSARCRP
ncbi:hypothetical protein ACWC5I_48180, partial [Kitasatospora sp. NPDC001574]